ncbi:adenosylcobinamide-GDP ribazoletransferase [Bartonella sp. LJL80]
MRDFISPTMRALAFLSRLSVSNRWFSANYTIADDAAYFPIAGALIGLFGSICLGITFMLGFTDGISAFIAIMSVTIATGALHEDGLADVADAFFVTKDKEQRLAIMKDSHIGTYGTLALIFSVGLRTALFTTILTNNGLLSAALALIVAEAASRGGMVWLWSRLPLARLAGTAAKAGHPTAQSSLCAIVSAIAIMFLGALGVFGLFWFISALIVSALFIMFFSVMCLRRIGGYTGDTLGATQQCLMVLLLVTFHLAC